MDASLTDPRWRRLQESSIRCASCGEAHQGVFDLACFAPGAWPGEGRYQPNGELNFDKDFLSEDFCVIGGEHFFVRGVLEIPLIGFSEQFAYGVWSSLSRESFKAYVDGFDEGRDLEASWFSWFGNRLNGYPDTFNLRCRARPRSGRRRPQIELDPSDHPLSLEQRNGMSFDRLLEIYALNGHDLRAALTTEN